VGWALRRSCLGAFVVVSGSTFSSMSRAEPTWLGWRAPEECQNTSEVERRLESLLGHPVDFATLPATLVRMGWSAERGWSVRVTVELATGPRDRALDAPTCADAFDVVALSLALILDPSLGLGEAPAAGAAPDDDGSGSGLAIDGTPALSDEQAPLLASLPPSPPDERLTGAELRADGTATRGSPRAARPLTLVAGGGPLTDSGIFPVPQFGGGVHVGLGLGRFQVELEGDILASETKRFSGAQYPVGFYSYFAGVRGCYNLELSARFGWVGCMGGEVGSLSTHERGGDEHRAQGLWLAAEALTGPELAATDWLRAFARLRGVSPLIRHDFLLSEGSRVHSLPWFSPQLQVGIELDVTDFGERGH
jgi:hypothetical protein